MAERVAHANSAFHYVIGTETRTGIKIKIRIGTEIETGNRTGDRTGVVDIADIVVGSVIQAAEFVA